MFHQHVFVILLWGILMSPLKWHPIEYDGMHKERAMEQSQHQNIILISRRSGNPEFQMKIWASIGRITYQINALLSYFIKIIEEWEKNIWKAGGNLGWWRWLRWGWRWGGGHSRRAPPTVFAKFSFFKCKTLKAQNVQMKILQ